MDYKFFTTCNKNTCHDLIIIIFLDLLEIFLKIFTSIIYVSYILFIHDISMYIHIMYINAHIHQGLNPRLHGDAPRSSPPNHFKSSIR
jgi:hypothetical protein